MEAKINIIGEVGEDVVLADILAQLKSYDEYDSIHATIDSIGGTVDEGDKIYKYLTSLEVPVTTYAIQAYSIASKIFCAGTKRIAQDKDNVLMIHLPWANVEGTADELEYYASEMRNCENKLVEFYSDFLNVDSDTVHDILDSETYLSGKACLDMGFATELEETTTVKNKVKAVAKLKLKQNINVKKNNMKKSKLESLAKNVLATIQKTLNPKDLILQDSTGVEIDFVDLGEGDTPKVGDKAEVDGSVIEDGTYIMPSLDNASVTFVDGVVTEIEEEETEESKAKAKAKAKKLNAKNEVIQEVSVWNLEVIDGEFNIGDVVMRKGWDEDDEPSPIFAGEFRLADGRTIVTNAAGEIVSVDNESSLTDPVVENKEKEEATEKQIEETVSNIVSKALKAQNKIHQKEIQDLKKTITSKQIEIEKENSLKSQKSNNLADILRS